MMHMISLGTLELYTSVRLFRVLRPVFTDICEILVGKLCIIEDEYVVCSVDDEGLESS